VGTGLPAIINIGGTLKLAHYIGAGVTLGLIPSIELSYYGEAEVSYQHLDIYGRIYPFGGGFFFGAGAGYATVEGTLTKTVTSAEVAGLSGSVRYDSQGSVRTLVLTPVLGYLHTFGSGFSLGIDAGMQVPIAPSEVEFESKTSGSIPPQFQPVVDQALAPTDAAVRDTLETIGRTPLPTFNLRLGWLL
jgi:hypothetical protein